MKVAFFGCGYLGYNLSSKLRDDFDIVIYGLKSPYTDKASWFKEMDCFNEELLKQENLKDAVIVDTVSIIGVNSKSDNEEVTLNNLKMRYQNLFRVLKEQGIKRYVFFSSGGTIYGDSEVAIDESHSLNPKNLYARSKELLEGVLKESGLDYLIVRPTNPYGGYQVNDNGQGVIPILINKALKKEVFEMWVDPNSTRDYIYIDDFSEALKLLIKKDINNEIVNISSGEGISLGRVIETIERELGIPVLIERKESQVALVKNIVLSNAKLKSLTGYEACVGFDEGIGREVRRIKEEQE